MLVQHGVCVFSSGRRGPGSPTEYRTSCDRILRILRFPRYIYTAKTLYGDTGELIVEELLQRGELTMSSTVKTVSDRLTQNMEGQLLGIRSPSSTDGSNATRNDCVSLFQMAAAWTTARCRRLSPNWWKPIFCSAALRWQPRGKRTALPAAPLRPPATPLRRASPTATRCRR